MKVSFKVRVFDGVCYFSAREVAKMVKEIFRALEYDTPTAKEVVEKMLERIDKEEGR